MIELYALAIYFRVDTHLLQYINYCGGREHCIKLSWAYRSALNTLIGMIKIKLLWLIFYLVAIICIAAS